MLDLNVASPDDGKLREYGSTAPTDEPGTSNSSVLNAEGSSNAGDEESCCTRSAGGPAFRFGIHKDVDDDGDAEEVEEGGRFVEEVVNDSSFVMGPPRSEIFTRQLFPMGASHVGGNGSAYDAQAVMVVAQMGPSSSATGPHWVGFSKPEERVKQQQQPQQQVKKSRRGPRSRSSQYRGVTFYRRTGRWESHIWDCGKQVYLGGFDTAHAAARAYDRAAIKFRGVDADINFQLSDYDEDLNQTRNLTKEEFVHVLRRQSTGFSRGSSKYRGVTLHKCGRWEARMGQFLGKKAYDKAAIKCNGREAVTNFEPSTYEGEVASEMDTEASVHSIDLDLKISQPISHSAMHHDDTTNFQIQRGFLEASDSRKSRDNLALLVARPHGLTAAPENAPPFFPASYPGYPAIAQEQALGKRPQVGSPALPNWAWHAHRSALLPMFPSAASSGFSPTTVTAALPPSQATLSTHLSPPPPSTKRPPFLQELNPEEECHSQDGKRSRRPTEGAEQQKGQTNF